MSRKTRRNSSLLVTVLVTAGLSVGCRLVALPVVVAVGAVGAVGYTVYKGGESVVTGVGNLGSDEAEDESAGVETVVYSEEALTIECDGSVEAVWQAATRAFQRANFQELAGNYDLLSGELTAKTWDRVPVTLRLKSVDQSRTTVWLWAGPEGGLKGAESIYNLIHEELEKTR
jgi:hypothetical protein